MDTQNQGDVACMARMSCVIRITIVGSMPAIMAFIDIHSGKNELRSALP